MAEPIRQITTTARKPSSSGYDPYDLLFTGTDSADFFSEDMFGEGAAAPTEGMIDALLAEIEAERQAALLASLTPEERKKLNLNTDDTTAKTNISDPMSYDMENALALGAAKEAGLDAGGPFGSSLTRRTPSVLELLQTGPVQPDAGGGGDGPPADPAGGDPAGGGDGTPADDTQKVPGPVKV